MFESYGAFMGHINGPGILHLSFASLPLMQGSYFLSIGVYQQNWEFTYDYLFKVSNLIVEGQTSGSGIFYSSHRWQI